VSGTKTGVDGAEKSDGRSGALSERRKKRAERSAEREVTEREQSGERAESVAHRR